MALCRRRAVGNRLIVLVSAGWALMLFFYLFGAEEAVPPPPLPDNLPPPKMAVLNAREEIDRILKSSAIRPLPAPAGRRPPATPGLVTRARARSPSSRSPSGRQDGDPRGYLLPPQQAHGPGEMGKPVHLPANLTRQQQELVDAGWKDNAFNQFVSDMVSPHRTLPDVRDDRCRERRDWGQLPDTGVVVCFHNEAWSTLIRTVHSVLDRSPQHLLKEIVLVDDHSDRPHLGAPLDQYISQYPRVRIVRLSKREGLIRGRLAGARRVTAQVVTFLDSHCECTEGWLEPLLDRIALNRTTVVTPVIDVINDNTLEYHFQGAAATSVGGFDWNLQFNWHAVPERERRVQGHPSNPVASPTMAGGLFAIDKQWFEQLGTYDEQFDIWGGENLELSFKTWMCGGRLETVPCSHVGHIFRKRSPYTWRSGENVLRKNSIRLAEVWMDEYKQYYYERTGAEKDMHYGDVSSRRALRKRLNCKSFDWYIKNVFPDLFIPGDAVAKGEVRNVASGMCLDSQMDHDQLYKPLGLYPCHNLGGNQFFMLTKLGEIRRDETCLDYSGQDVVLYPCHGSRGNQAWKFNPITQLVRHEVGQLCMSVLDKKKISMVRCNSDDGRQRWSFQNYNSSRLH